MKPRERFAWLLVVALTATTTALWWRGRDRYEFRAGSTGQVLWKLDRQTGQAWVSFSSSPTWKPVSGAPSARDIFDDMVEGGGFDQNAAEPKPSAK